jgi:hypothetical protein
MSKVANLIVAHKNPAQLVRLVNRFDARLFHNFIHIDGRQSLAAYAELRALPHVTLLEPRRKLNWAGYGFVQVTLEGMATILKHDDHFGYISVMSGQDYPIRASESLYEHVYGSGGMEFFDVIAVDPDWPVALHRYEGYHFIEWSIRGRYRLEGLINAAMGKRRFYNGKLRPYGRSAWFTATRDFAAYTLRYMDTHPDFVRFLKTVWSPDEFVFNTLVMNSSFQEKVAPTNLRYIDWSEGKVNPKVLTTADFSALRDSGSFLARKFDVTMDAAILDLLDVRAKEVG